MKYIMVTDFDNHWNCIEENFTSYPSKMIKPKITKKNLRSGTETVFIKKLKDSDEVEKVWKGKVENIENLAGKVFFRVIIDKEISCPEEYSLVNNGWYIEL